MSETVFLRMLADENKEAALAEALGAARDGLSDPRVFATDPESFRQVPGTPFAYWIGETVRSKFVELPPFES